MLLLLQLPFSRPSRTCIFQLFLVKPRIRGPKEPKQGKNQQHSSRLSASSAGRLFTGIAACAVLGSILSLLPPPLLLGWLLRLQSVDQQGEASRNAPYRTATTTTTAPLLLHFLQDIQFWGLFVLCAIARPSVVAFGLHKISVNSLLLLHCVSRPSLFAFAPLSVVCGDSIGVIGCSGSCRSSSVLVGLSFATLTSLIVLLDFSFACILLAIPHVLASHPNQQLRLLLD